MIEEKFIGKRLAQLRVQKNVSARDMSLSLGQSPSYINNIENDKALPSMQMFLYICDYLKVHPKDFFNDEVENPKLMSEAFDILKNISGEQLQNLLKLAKDLK